MTKIIKIKKIRIRKNLIGFWDWEFYRMKHKAEWFISFAGIVICKLSNENKQKG